MEQPPQRVAVTGAAGLVGACLAKRLVARGAQVVAVDDFSIGVRQTASTGSTEWVDIDVASPEIADVLDGAACDVVVHTAAHPGGRSLQEPTENTRVNALGAMRVFEWCARAGVPLVFPSSSVIYGDQPAGPILESASPEPGTVYAVAKVASEQWLRVLGEGYGLPWTVLRLFATYGAGHRPSTHQGIVNIMLTQVMAGDRVVVKGSLDRLRDLVYVEDAAAALVEAVYRPEARGKIINVGTGSGVSIRELLVAICRVLDRDFDGLEIIEEAGVIGDPFSNIADCRRSRDILGFIPRFDLEAGLAELVVERRAREKRG